MLNFRTPDRSRSIGLRRIGSSDGHIQEHDVVASHHQSYISLRPHRIIDACYGLKSRERARQAINHLGAAADRKSFAIFPSGQLQRIGFEIPVQARSIRLLHRRQSFYQC